MLNALSEEQKSQIKNARTIFRPQPGGQTLFLSSSADFVLYGGQAGGGKTYSLMLECLRNSHIKGFDAVIFRREMKQITAAGGLWDESSSIFPYFGAKPNVQRLKWVFPSEATIGFAGLELEADKLKWQGSQICLLCFDETTHFTETQFRYLMTRNRSTSGVKPYIRATCNPDPDSWVKRFVEWYLLPQGTPDHSKRGIIRYFGLKKNDYVFGETPKELFQKYGIEEQYCKTYTFIYATLDDNQKLLEKDPGYVTNLKLAGEIESEALLHGNWNIKKVGKLFKPEDFKIYTVLPKFKYKIIVADTAQKTKEANDYSVLQCWGICDKGIYLIDQLRGKYEYPDLETLAISFVHKHSDVKDIFVEDKVSGSSLIQSLRRKILKPIVAIQRNKDKYTRAFDAQGYIKSGYVFVSPLTDYYTDYINEMVSFNPEGDYAHDDQADCTFDAIELLLINPRYKITQDEHNLSFKPQVVY
jgi:predicted phage terminase large subunit-like protein